MNINNVDGGITVKKVRATKGKMLRAEPVAGLYENGKVHHVGSFPELEYEMTSYTGKAGEKSPNRLDAAVYALSYLSQDEHEELSIGWV